MAGGTFRSLRVRNFRLFFVGQLISNVGNWLTNVGLTLLVLHLTGSGLAVGALAACSYGPVLVLGAFAGLIADRSDKHRLLMVTQTLEMLQSASLAVLAFLPHPPLAGLYGVALAGGLMLAFDNPVRRSFVSEMVPGEQIANAVTLNTAMMNASRVVGPALAGFLAVTVGFGWCFTLDAVSYLAVLAALARMRRAELLPAATAPRGRGQVRAGLRYVRGQPLLFVPLVMLGVIGTLTYNFTVVIPLFVEKTLHGSDGAYTLVYSTLAFGSLLGALLAARRHSIGLPHAVAGALLLAAFEGVFAAAPTVWSCVPIVLAVGISSMTFMTATTALVQMEAAPEMRGRVLALQSILLIGTTPIGGPLLGLVVDAFGGRAALLVGALAAAAAGTWGLLAYRRERVILPA